MPSQRTKCRYATYFCLPLVLALQCATPSLALPALDPVQISVNHQESCATVDASRTAVQPTPTYIAELLGDDKVQNLVLPLPVKETNLREKAALGALADDKRDRRASSVLCRGAWTHRSLPPNALMLFEADNVLDSKSDRSGGHRTRALYLLLSTETLSKISLRGNVTLTLTCSNSLSYCFNILYKSAQPGKSGGGRLLRRSANNVAKDSHHFPTGSHATPVIAVVVAIVSLVALISLVALCAGSSAYDPQETGAGVKLQKSASDAPPSEVTVQFQSPKPVQVEVETTSEPAATINGAVRENAEVKNEKKSSPKHKDSIDPKTTPQREVSERESRSRTLSARSFDPLPEIPKLETAEDKKGQRSKSPPSAGGDDEDDEAGYAYARVGGMAVGGMDEADSDKEDKAGGNAGQSSELPPYGKVSHHVTKTKVVETEEYAEVKEMFRGPEAVNTKRNRSATDPIDPADAKTDSVRDKRALTHTHMMPLPAVPKQHVSVEENEMYDSIPDDMRNSQVPLPQATAAAAQRPRPKERLYESMDEIEDTYESVPDNLKPDSPLPVSPASPSHSPSKLPLPGPSTPPPLPPSSPVPKPQPKEYGEKKQVEKTLSASQAEGDGKRRFSFFGRKKTASVSAVSKKEKKEKEKHADKEHHMHHQPLPNVPALSPVTSPPLPPIPANDDDDDTMYDTPQLDFMAGPLRISPGPPPISPGMMDAKAKSQSLPSSVRGAGAIVFHGPRVNIPLPRVPEDSGQGVVIRERVMESPFRGEEEEKPYDSVKVLQGMDGEKPYDTVKVLNELEDINEPNYDTVDKEEILKAVAEAENLENEPGYDRVKKLEEQENGGQREREKAPTPQPREVEGAGIKYGKVTRPLSPEDDTPGILPEHDEEGYAVVPEDFKMRKRALSASKGVQPQVKHESPEPTVVKMSFDEHEETTSPAEPSEPYATVDIIAKKKSKDDKGADSLATEANRSRQQSASPIPPPLPPVGDLGDVVGEYSEPPIPIQSEGVLELLSPERSSTLKPPGSDDPPYAKVKSKDHPYAELDLGAGGELAKLATQENKENSEAGYDEVGRDASQLADPKDKALGYDTVTDPEVKQEVKQEVVEDEALGYNTIGDPQISQEVTAAVYDTLIDSDKAGGEDGLTTNQLKDDTPKLEPAEPQQQLYDSLEPLEKENDDQGEAGNLYDSLEPDPPPHQMQNGVSAEAMEEERYEEIDDERRLELITKQKLWSQSKSS